MQFTGGFSLSNEVLADILVYHTCLYICFKIMLIV